MKKSRAQRGLRNLRGALRFVSAFRKRHLSLADALAYELSMPDVERAATPIYEEGGFYGLSKIALVYTREQVRRVYASDCWSELLPSGRLAPTRNRAGKDKSFSCYSEAFLKKKAYPVAIFVDKDSPDEPIPQEVADVARKTGLEILSSFDGQGFDAFFKARKYRRW